MPVSGGVCRGLAGACKHSQRNVPGRVTAPLWLVSCIALLSPRTGVLTPQRTHPTLSPPAGKLPPSTCEGDWASLLPSWPTPDAWNSHAMHAPSPPTLGNLWECTLSCLAGTKQFLASSNSQQIFTILHLTMEEMITEFLGIKLKVKYTNQYQRNKHPNYRN